MSEPRPRPPAVFGLTVAVVLIALLPWWRNHGYLRDLYDYGLVIAANGHLERGDRPYVDFKTPIQAGFLGLNWLIEKTGGGNYAGLTRGGAGLIVLTGAGLTVLLARRWPVWAAAIMALSVTAGAASQHTILWHNALGVSCLAFATWAAACAPVFRRATWPWHVVAIAALLLGGINKLNFQLIAVTCSVAWALRAALTHKSGWGRAGATIAAIVAAGLVLPVAAEMIWTGASLQTWFDNVIRLASGSRGHLLWAVLSVKFLVQPIHDYYGPQWLPQVGLAGLALSGAAFFGCRPPKSAAAGPDRWLLPAAVLLAAGGGAALLATNFEISSLGLAAWLVLIVSVWLGFGGAHRGRWFTAGLVLPALLLGVAAWHSAWLGQRSQFGYSAVPRSEYRPATEAGPAYARMAGLRLPPEVVVSLTAMDISLPSKGENGLHPVFFSVGLEWARRFFAVPVGKGHPLWVHWDTTYDATTLARLREDLADEDGPYRVVLTTLARDEWPAEIRAVLERSYLPDLVGPVVRRWTRRDHDAVNLANSFDTLARMGGNLDGHYLHFDRTPLRFKRAADGRVLLGTSRAAGNVLLRAPTHRVRGVAVLDRWPKGGTGPLHVDLKVIAHGGVPEDVKWAARLELPAGEQSVTLPFEFDAHGQRLEFWVTRPDGQVDHSFAGYRELEITHGIEDPAGVPILRPRKLDDVTVTPEMAASLFGGIAWRPTELTIRGGRAGPDGLLLSSGGEIWLHTDGMTGEIRGQLTWAGATEPPFVRVVWFKGGRLQLLQNSVIPAGRPFDFHVWTAEPGGWIGIQLDHADGAGDAKVRVTSTTLIP